MTVTHPNDVSATEVREWAVEHFPHLVRVSSKMADSLSDEDQSETPSSETGAGHQDGEGVSVADEWGEYHREARGSAPPEKWVEAVRYLEAEALA